ncbi:hypothetical protein ABTD98_21825, partial [Acinetobacter baumannii]
MLRYGKMLIISILTDLIKKLSNYLTMSNHIKNKATTETPAPVSNFLRAIIDNDLTAGKYARDSL